LCDKQKLAVGGRGALFWLLFWAFKKVTKKIHRSIGRLMAKPATLVQLNKISGESII
jgi:hypothetical protein